MIISPASKVESSSHVILYSKCFELDRSRLLMDSKRDCSKYREAVPKVSRPLLTECHFGEG